jgi:hypothetical protein
MIAKGPGTDGEHPSDGGRFLPATLDSDTASAILLHAFRTPAPSESWVATERACNARATVRRTPREGHAARMRKMGLKPGS